MLNTHIFPVLTPPLHEKNTTPMTVFVHLNSDERSECHPIQKRRKTVCTRTRSERGLGDRKQTTGFPFNTGESFPSVPSKTRAVRKNHDYLSIFQHRSISFCLEPLRAIVADRVENENTTHKRDDGFVVWPFGTGDDILISSFVGIVRY